MPHFPRQHMALALKYLPPHPASAPLPETLLEHLGMRERYHPVHRPVHDHDPAPPHSVCYFFQLHVGFVVPTGRSTPSRYYQPHWTLDAGRWTLDPRSKLCFYQKSIYKYRTIGKAPRGATLYPSIFLRKERLE